LQNIGVELAIFARVDMFFDFVVFGRGVAFDDCQGSRPYR